MFFLYPRTKCTEHFLRFMSVYAHVVAQSQCEVQLTNCIFQFFLQYLAYPLPVQVLSTAPTSQYTPPDPHKRRG